MATLERVEDFAGLVTATAAASGLTLSAGASFTAGPWPSSSAVVLAGAGDSAIVALSNGQVRYIGARFYLPALGGSVLTFRDGGTNRLAINVDATGHVLASQDWGSGLQAIAGAASVNPVVHAGEWFYLEVAAKITDGGTGWVRAHVNGAEVVNVANVATSHNASSNVNGAVFGLCGGSGIAGTKVADMYASPDGFFGDLRLIPLTPDADGAYAEWPTLVGAASAHAAVAADDGDTSYIASSTPGERATFARTSSAPTVAGAVLAVVCKVAARKDDAGARTVAGLLYDGSTLATAAAPAALSTSYAEYAFAFATNPAGGEWTVAGAYTAEIGAVLSA